jgi:hypothetical protein
MNVTDKGNPMKPYIKPVLSSPPTTPEYPRLPCRGCLADCPNYASCNGTPWRAMAAAAKHD